MKAVDSEHTGKLQSDARRVQSVFRKLGNPAHPINTFHAGNIETLWTTPKAQGRDVREALIRFVEQHYSANLMTRARFIDDRN